MIKSDHQAHVSTRFDFNTLPLCGAKTRAGGSCKHKAISAMVAVNYMVANPQARKNPLVAHATLATPTDREPRKQSPYARKWPTYGKH